MYFDEHTDLYTIFRQIIHSTALELMVEQINLHGNRLKSSRNSSQKEYRRINLWKDVTESEMFVFLGVLLPGLVPFPTIECYWKKDKLYYWPLLHEIGTSYNRFNMLLRC